MQSLRCRVTLVRLDGHRSRAQRGTVTAEAAVVLPVVAAVALALVWLISLAIMQVRVVDAARDAARSAARGDAQSVAVAQARRTTTQDASVRFERQGDQLTVTVTVQAAAPGWLLVPLPAVTLDASSTMIAEDAKPRP
ncbi:MAG: TadE family type IV pilus minor pilin [Nocardioidaceae bacterium]